LRREHEHERKRDGFRYLYTGACPSSKVRHEVAPITVKPAFAGLHPLFHQQFRLKLLARACVQR
jgi:hypothetical protein